MQENDYLLELFGCLKEAKIFSRMGDAFAFLFRYSEPSFPYQVIKKTIGEERKNQCVLSDFCFKSIGNCSKYISGQYEFYTYDTPCSYKRNKKEDIFGNTMYINMFTNTNSKEIINRYAKYLAVHHMKEIDQLFVLINERFVENDSLNIYFAKKLKSIFTNEKDKVECVSEAIFSIVRERVFYDALKPFVPGAWYENRITLCVPEKKKEENTILYKLLKCCTHEGCESVYSVYKILVGYPTDNSQKNLKECIGCFDDIEGSSLESLLKKIFFSETEDREVDKIFPQSFLSANSNIHRYIYNELPMRVVSKYIDSNNKKQIIHKMKEYFNLDNNNITTISDRQCYEIVEKINNSFLGSENLIDTQKIIKKYNNNENICTSRDSAVGFICNVAYSIILYVCELQYSTKREWWQEETGKNSSDLISSEEENEILQANNEFVNLVSRFPIGTIERYNSLIYLVKETQNCYAAHELGDLYYTGGNLTYESKKYKNIKVDYKLAQYYYSIAAKSKYYPSCWALADMLLKQTMFTEDCHTVADYYPEKEIMNLLDIPKEEKYSPALNTLGVIYKNKADKCKDDKKQYVEYFGIAFDYFMEASNLDNAFASNRLFGLHDELNEIKFDLKSKRSNRLDDVDSFCKKKLFQSCKLGNPWALNKYCCKYLFKISDGKILTTDEEEYERGIKYLHIAANQGGFYWAEYNLAKYVYKDKINASQSIKSIHKHYQNEELYIEYLSSAAEKKLAIASYDLGLYYLEKGDKAMAKEMFKNAYEQNKNGVDRYNKGLEEKIKDNLNNLIDS